MHLNPSRIGSVRGGKQKPGNSSRSRGRQAVANVVFELLETRQMMTAFAYSGSMQTYTVAATGEYEITAVGGQGGSRSGGGTGGMGAVLNGEVTLTAGTQLDVVVGGSSSSTVATGGRGGGGGSFVYVAGAAQPLVVAGGGGGADGFGTANGGYAQTGEAGANAIAPHFMLDMNLGQGGTGGQGGTSGSYGAGDAGGGGGWLGNGTGGYEGGYGGLGGDGPPSFAGGAGDNAGVSNAGITPRADGGFGGGGGGSLNGGGGGGGYSGGGGGDGSYGDGSAGGGGGSYFDPSVTSTSTMVTGTGNGSVSITGLLEVSSQTVSVTYERSKTILLSANEPGVPITYALVSHPADGALTGFNATTGIVTYTPQAGFSGTDSFNFSASDGTSIATGSVTLDVAASNTAPWMSTQSDSIPLSDLSLPGTVQSASGPSLVNALFGNGSNNIVSTGPLAESDEALHITASLTTAAISGATALNSDNPVLDAAGAAADAAASSADFAEDQSGSTGVGLGLSLASDITTEASDANTIVQDAVTALTANDDVSTGLIDATEEGDAGIEATDHTKAVTANTPAAVDDGASGTANGTAATDAGITGTMNTTSGADNASAGGLNASSIIADGAAEVEGGIDPVADDLAGGDDALSSAEDDESALEDVSTDAADTTSDIINVEAMTANDTGTAANTAAESADGNAGEEDGATQMLVTNLILALNTSATNHTKTAVSDGLSAGYMGAGSVADAYTAAQFKTYYTVLGNPSTTGGNGNNNALQMQLSSGALAEFTNHTASATAEGAAAIADGVAVGLDSAAAVADRAAVTAVQQEVSANMAAVSANAMAVAFEQIAEDDDASAAMEEVAADGVNKTALGDNTTAGVNNAAAGVTNAVSSAANLGAGAADLASDILNATALATVEIPVVDAGTAAAAAIADGVEIGLDLTSDGADDASIIADGTTTAIDATSEIDDDIAAGIDETEATDAGEASMADEMALTYIAQASQEDTTAALADAAAAAACGAADTANAAADTADKAANGLNTTAGFASATAASADATFTAEAVTVQTTETSLQTQTLSIPEQLNEGVRSLDLQTGVVNNTINVNAGQYFTGTTLKGALDNITSFLQSNPSETVVVTLGNESGGATPQSFDQDLNSLLTSTDAAVPGTTYQSFVYSDANGNPSHTPALGDARGKIVFVPAADHSWNPSADTSTKLIGWQPATQVTQDSHAVTDPNTRWDYAENDNGANDNGLIPTDLGSSSTLYRNNLNQDNTFSATLTETTTAVPPTAILTISGTSPIELGDTVDTIATTYFGEVKVSRTAGIVGINDPLQGLVTEIENENNLPILVTSDSDAAGATGTLRDAIVEANAQPGFNTIDFAPMLSGSTGNLVILQADLPAITNDLVIGGPVTVNLDGYQGFSYGATHTVTETDLPASDNGLGMLATTTNSAPLYVDTSRVTVVTETAPVVDPVNITYGQQLQSTKLQGMETSVSNGTITNVPGSFAYNTANESIPHAGNGQTTAVTFTPKDPSLSPSSTTVIFNVAKVTPQLSSLQSVNITYGTALANSQLAGNHSPPGISGAFTYDNAGTLLNASPSGQNEVVTFTPTDALDYTSVSSTVSVIVARATPTVTGVNAVTLNYGTPLDNSQLSGTATFNVNGTAVNVAGTFTYTNGVGVVLNGGNSGTESVTFTPADSTDYTTARSVVTVNVFSTQDMPTIVSVNPVNISYGTVLNNSQLSGMATFVLNGNTLTLPGTFSYNTASGTLLGAGQGQTEAVTFTPAALSNYTTASSTVVVNVARAVATIQDPVNITYGTSLTNSQLQGTATFNVAGNIVTVPGSFAYVNAGAVLPAGNGQIQPIIFTPTDLVDFAPASSTVTVNVAQVTPILSYSVQNGSTEMPIQMPGIAPVNIEYTTALTSNAQPTGSENLSTISAPFNVGGSIVTLPGSLAYKVVAGQLVGVSASFNVSGTTLVVPGVLTDSVVGNQAEFSAAFNVPGSVVNAPDIFTSNFPAAGSTQLAATASYVVNGVNVTVPGLLTYTTAAGTVLNPGNGQSEAVTFTPTDTTDFAAVFSNVTVNVSQQVPQVILTDGSPVVVTGNQFSSYSSLYTGSPQPATGMVLQTNNVSIGSPVISYYLATDTKLASPLPGAPTSVGNYLVVGTFAAPNANFIASGDTIDFSITPAATATTVTDAGGIYNGSPFPATTSKVTGTAGLNTTASSFSYTGTGSTVYAATAVAPTNAGTYAVTAIYNGDANHSGSSITVPFTISKAVSSTSITDAGGTFSGSPFTATSTVTGAGKLSTTASSYLYTGTGGTTYNSSTAPTNVGTYNVTAAYSGDLNHTASSAAAAFTIGLATSTTTVVAGGSYTGSPVVATITVTGAGGLKTTPTSVTYVGTASTVYNASTTAPINPGTYSVTATYIGDANHTGSTSGSIAFSISQATPLITLTDAGGVYNGSAYPATATVTGLNNASITSPAVTLLYYAGATISGTGSSIAPMTAGTYTVVATFAGNTDYSAASASKTFSIAAINTSIALKSSTSGSSYYGQSVTFTATVTSASGTPAGSVQFFSGTTSLGTVALVNGAAALTTSNLSIAGNVITANYLPSTPNYNSSSTSLMQSVTAGIILLDTKSAGALSVSGSGKVNASGTSIVVDSTNSQAIQITGVGVVESNQTNVVGGAYVQPYSGTATNLHTAQASVADPFAALATPTTTGLTVQSKSTLSVGGNSVITLQPGVYIGGINIGGSAKVTLAPGIYYLQGGGLNIGGSTTVTGQGVLIYNAAVSAGDQINVNGSGSLKLSPMTTGTWAGMAIFQARTSAAAIVVSGSGSLNVTGTIYAASAAVDIQGSGVIDTFGSSLIADDLNDSGVGELLI